MNTQDVTVGSRWRDNRSGAIFEVVRTEDNGAMVVCRWEEGGGFSTEMTSFITRNEYSPVSPGKTW